MNGDLISREAAIKAVEMREPMMVGNKTIGVEALKNFLRNRPAVDAAPVVHGRWIHDNNNRYGCSECMAREIMSYRNPKNYCPNCGAKMDLEE